MQTLHRYTPRLSIHTVDISRGSRSVTFPTSSASAQGQGIFVSPMSSLRPQLFSPLNHILANPVPRRRHRKCTIDNNCCTRNILDHSTSRTTCCCTSSNCSCHLETSRCRWRASVSRDQHTAHGNGDAKSQPGSKAVVAAMNAEQKAFVEQVIRSGAVTGRWQSRAGRTARSTADSLEDEFWWNVMNFCRMSMERMDVAGAKFRSLCSLLEMCLGLQVKGCLAMHEL
ncbi:hypothetical protein MRB53_039619 [Persea americana]|nr:hypothetical protein MRB53_039619 [Persea americana]